MGNEVVGLKCDKSLFLFCIGLQQAFIHTVHKFKLAFYEVSGLIQYLSVKPRGVYFLLSLLMLLISSIK